MDVPSQKRSSYFWRLAVKTALFTANAIVVAGGPIDRLDVEIPITRDNLRFAKVGAGDGNRTHVSSLGSYSSTIELHPQRRIHAYLRLGTGMCPPRKWRASSKSH